MEIGELGEVSDREIEIGSRGMREMEKRRSWQNHQVIHLTHKAFIYHEKYQVLENYLLPPPPPPPPMLPGSLLV